MKKFDPTISATLEFHEALELVLDVDVDISEMHDETKVTYGFLKAYLIDGFGLKRSEMSWLADIDENFVNIVSHIGLEGEGDKPFAGRPQVFGRIAYIEQIKIQEDYRGNGIGSSVLNQFFAMLRTLSIEYVFLTPFPLGVDPDVEISEAHKEEVQRLVNYYTRLGFVEWIPNCEQRYMHLGL